MLINSDSFWEFQEHIYLRNTFQRLIIYLLKFIFFTENFCTFGNLSLVYVTQSLWIFWIHFKNLWFELLQKTLFQSFLFFFFFRFFISCYQRLLCINGLDVKIIKFNMFHKQKKLFSTLFFSQVKKLFVLFKLVWLKLSIKIYF